MLLISILTIISVILICFVLQPRLDYTESGLIIWYTNKEGIRDYIILFNKED